MHSKREHHKLRFILAISLLAACGLSQLAAADPVVSQEAAPATTGRATPTELTWNPVALVVEDTAGQNQNVHTHDTAPQLTARGAPDLATEIRGTLKDNIRPLHEQVMNSGAMLAWNDLKSDMGLRNTNEDTEGTATARSMMASQWESSNPTFGQDPGHRQRTTGHAEIDRELTTHMLEKLIDEIKPWALSLIGLYMLGYLIKTGYDYTQRKSIRRRERAVARARRRSARHAGHAKPGT